MDGVNIALAEKLVKVAESVDLPVEEAQAVLTTRSFAKAVDADWQRSMDMSDQFFDHPILSSRYFYPGPAVLPLS